MDDSIPSTPKNEKWIGLTVLFAVLVIVAIRGLVLVFTESPGARFRREYEKVKQDQDLLREKARRKEMRRRFKERVVSCGDVEWSSEDESESGKQD
jgi:hypothetical protein